MRKGTGRARIEALNEASHESKPFRYGRPLSKLQSVSCDLTVALRRAERALRARAPRLAKRMPGRRLECRVRAHHKKPTLRARHFGGKRTRHISPTKRAAVTVSSADDLDSVSTRREVSP
jgi:hypothetical protein